MFGYSNKNTATREILLEIWDKNHRYFLRIAELFGSKFGIPGIHHSRENRDALRMKWTKKMIQNRVETDPAPAFGLV